MLSTTLMFKSRKGVSVFELLLYLADVVMNMSEICFTNSGLLMANILSRYIVKYVEKIYSFRFL